MFLPLERAGLNSGVVAPARHEGSVVLPGENFYNIEICESESIET